jgi:hypothetical protein
MSTTDKPKKPRLTWKLHARETGLAASGAGPRGSDLRIDGVPVAAVRAIGGGWRGPVTGWYWFCPADLTRGIAHENTARTPSKTVDEAKAACEAYIRAQLAAKEGT